MSYLFGIQSVSEFVKKFKEFSFNDTSGDPLVKNIVETLEEKFGSLLKAASATVTTDKITPETVFQKADLRFREGMFEFISDYLTEGSRLVGAENLIKLYEKAKAGESCLILSSHLSNSDVPNFFGLSRQHSKEALEAFEHVIFIAGRKLNEEYPFVKLITSMYSRVVIVPKPEIPSDPKTEDEKRQVQEAFAINIAAQRKVKELKLKGNIFLVYPTGTRSRMWQPETYQGLPEVTTYIKSFNNILFASYDGLNMPVNRDSMANDVIQPSRIVYHFGEIISSKDFLSEIKAKYNIDADNSRWKSLVAKEVMDRIFNIFDFRPPELISKI